MLAHPERIVGAVECDTYRALLRQRLSGAPMAYLVGTREFFGIDLEVGPAVLIPRPDTELLVEAALERIPVAKPCRVLDLGTGSGAIAIAIARHRPLATVEAVDRSEAAMEVARRNVARTGAANVAVHLSDWYDGVRGETYDLVVSNPPYVREGDPHLSEGDVRFEPATALVSGADGLDAIRIIAAGASRRLAPGGTLLVEHGFDQGSACRDIFRSAGLNGVETLKDLPGNDRVCIGHRAS